MTGSCGEEALHRREDLIQANKDAHSRATLPSVTNVGGRVAVHFRGYAFTRMSRRAWLHYLARSDKRQSARI